MKRLLSLFGSLAVVMMLTCSCQKELPDAIKNVDVSQGGSQSTTPDNPTQQGDVPSEEDNPWPSY